MQWRDKLKGEIDRQTKKKKQVCKKENWGGRVRASLKNVLCYFFWYRLWKEKKGWHTKWTTLLKTKLLLWKGFESRKKVIKVFYVSKKNFFFISAIHPHQAGIVAKWRAICGLKISMWAKLNYSQTCDNDHLSTTTSLIPQFTKVNSNF